MHQGWNWTCRLQGLLGTPACGTGLRAPARGTGLRTLGFQPSKFLSGLLLSHTVIYGACKQTHNKEKEIKVLPLSSNQEKLRKEGWNYIFG